MIIPLKLKYRTPGRILHRGWDPDGGTLVYEAGGRFTSKTNNSGKKQLRMQGTGPRMKAYKGGYVQ